jgi:hypothetical protein
MVHSLSGSQHPKALRTLCGEMTVDGVTRRYVILPE